MLSSPIPVLFTHFGGQWIRGSEQVLLSLISNVDRDRITPVVWCNGHELAAALRDDGIPVYRTDFESFFNYDSSRFSPTRYWSFVREGVRLVKLHNIKVLHANGAAANQWLVPVARLTKRPILAHLHVSYLRRERFVSLLHQSTLVVGVSHQVIADFLSDGMKSDRTKVIYNGIDFDKLSASPGGNLRETLGIAESTLIIAGVGSLIHRKGYDVLIDAFSRLKNVSDIRLIIASDGPERGALQELVRSKDLEDHITFLGYTHEVAPLYRASDIFALASRNDAFGLVFAEAGHFSLPTVATRVGGIPEVVEHEETGLLVPPDDPAAFAGALEILIGDSILRRRFGAKARQKVETCFTLRQMVSQFEETYKILAHIPQGTLGWNLSTLSDLRSCASFFRPRRML